MRIGIFSQTAGNSYRAGRILSLLAEKNVTDVYCLGNLIGPSYIPRKSLKTGKSSRTSKTPRLREEDKETIEKFKEFFDKKTFRIFMGICGANEDSYLMRRGYASNGDDELAEVLARFIPKNYFYQQSEDLAYGFTSSGFAPEERALKPRNDLIENSERLKRIFHSAQKLNPAVKIVFVGRNRDRSILRLTNDSPIIDSLERRIYGPESINLSPYDPNILGAVISPSSLLSGYGIFDRDKIEFFN
jgi:hypothetical protein